MGRGRYTKPDNPPRSRWRRNRPDSANSPEPEQNSVGRFSVTEERAEPEINGRQNRPPTEPENTRSPRTRRYGSSKTQRGPPPPHPPPLQPAAAPSSYLFRLNGSLAGFDTKWEELHPYSQDVIRQINEKMGEYKYESERLDQCSRLFDSSAGVDSFELHSHSSYQDLTGITIAMKKMNGQLEEAMSSTKDVLSKTYSAINSYMMLRQRSLHASPAASFYSWPPNRPSPFLQNTVVRFETTLAQCCKVTEEIEKLDLVNTGKPSSSTRLLLNTLPVILSNVHDFLMYTAAKVENVHQCLESLRKASLTNFRHRRYGRDPSSTSCTRSSF